MRYILLLQFDTLIFESHLNRYLCFELILLIFIESLFCIIIFLNNCLIQSIFFNTKKNEKLALKKFDKNISLKYQ